MADSSTTTGPILDPIAGDCWARRQLHRGIRYVLRCQFRGMELEGPRKGGGSGGGGWAQASS